jgi:hypothetical protein
MWSLRKLWQVTRDPTCKTAFNYVTKTIKRMTRTKALERWETKAGNREVTRRALWPIAISLMKRDGPKAPTALHVHFGITYHPNEITNIILDFLENHFTSHDLFEENHERRVEIKSPNPHLFKQCLLLSYFTSLRREQML